MKTYKNLYSKIWDFENLHEAYLRARKGKRYRNDAMWFAVDLEANLIDIQNHLMWKTYRTGAYHYFTIHEPKERLIASLSFRDRVAHHALCNILEPIFERSFINDSYACRRGRGVLAGVLRTTQFLRDASKQWGDIYCLKCDIKKYFQSVNHFALKGIIRKKISCPDTLDMIDRIIDSTEDGTGMPIGNLTSQIFANVYLNELDHFIKETCRARYYVRYMDDFILIHHDKSWLHQMLGEIAGFLKNVLALCLNAKTQIFPVGRRAVDFLGYRIRADFKLLRKANLKRTKRKFRKYQAMYAVGQMQMPEIASSIKSWISHAGHADSWRIRTAVLDNLVFMRNKV